MIKTAILVDGGYFFKRYHNLFREASDYEQYNAEQTVKVFMKLIYDHISRRRERDSNSQQYLYRILFYDCVPLAKRVMNPVTGKPVNYAISDIYTYRTSFFELLKSQRKVALRLGKLKDNGGWQIKSSLTKKMIQGGKEIRDLESKDVNYQVQQKGVDMKIGLDIASLAYKRLVDQIILIAGDTDFVPAAKVARREGIDFILDPMHNKIDPSLNEHIDGLRSTSPKGGCSNIDYFLKKGNR